MNTPALVRVRVPGAGERVLAVTALFLLAYSLPSSWFLRDNADVPTGDTVVIAAFTALFAVALTRLVGSWKHVMRAVKREPLLLAFMFVLVASTAWSSTPDVTFRRSVALGLPVVLVSGEAADLGSTGDNVVSDYRRLAHEIIQHVRA